MQAERTALSWRRTALSLAVAAAGAGRVLAPVSPRVALAAALAFALAALATGASALRYRTVTRSLHRHDELVGPARAGVPVTVLAVCCCLGMLGVLVVVAFVE
ncbi:DUF202 domain-containing protein [Nocardioides bruguierae]|uniref:DUF202 domain-containing protein n=1 Tax=Nocardioides bruguierae TaxID=2945102 RepID=A0A9X2IFJ0_9ACTN|nr:DUF202 domain-containing protein [Nocardioides bruguierae]MCM0621367.1 DUF202 domain-containing protein [Nocardioides bruguierae]